MTQQMPAARLDAVSLGLAFGIMWALGVFILGIMAMTADWGTEIVVLMSAVYLGFDPTFGGSPEWVPHPCFASPGPYKLST